MGVAAAADGNPPKGTVVEAEVRVPKEGAGIPAKIAGHANESRCSPALTHEIK